MPAFPDPPHPFYYDWLSLIEPPVEPDDTQPCAATDAATEALAGMDAPLTWVREAEIEWAALDGYTPPETTPHWTTVDALSSELEQVEFSTVARDGTITVIATYPVGTPVMVTIMRVGGR